MKPYLYSLILVIPICAGLGMLWGGVWAWMTPLVVFGLIPLAETILPAPRSNDPQGEVHHVVGDVEGLLAADPRRAAGHA